VTGRSICTTQGLAKCFHCSCVLYQPIHLAAGDGGNYACSAVCSSRWILGIESPDRESFLLPELMAAIMLFFSFEFFMSCSGDFFSRGFFL